MKRFAIAAAVLMLGVSASAQTIASKKIENGGTGRYKAVVTTETGLENFTVYRPENMFTAANSEGKLPVILFGNGGCADSSEGFENFLTEIASHGYVVVALGPMPEFGKPKQQQPMTQEQIENMRKMASQPMTGPTEGVVNKQAPQRVAALTLLDALDVLAKISKDKNSPLYKSVNTKTAIAMGQSCGGTQALVLGTYGDKRIKSVVCLNSGVTSPGDFLSDVVIKSDLKKLVAPIIYIEGGKSDMAQKNGLDDYSLIKKTPVVMANYDAGHGGTYRESHGGAFAKMTLAWLSWQIKGKDKTDVFVKGKLADYPGWTVESKNFKN